MIAHLDYARFSSATRCSLYVDEVVVGASGCSCSGSEAVLSAISPSMFRYYDDKVPDAYEPELFHAPFTDDENVLKFGDIPAEIHIGRVDTGHHSLEVKVKTTTGMSNVEILNATTKNKSSTSPLHDLFNSSCLLGRSAPNVPTEWTRESQEGNSNRRQWNGTIGTNHRRSSAGQVE